MDVRDLAPTRESTVGMEMHSHPNSEWGHTLIPPQPTGRAHRVPSLLAKSSACQVKARGAGPRTYTISWVNVKVVRGCQKEILFGWA